MCECDIGGGTNCYHFYGVGEFGSIFLTQGSKL